jgi:alpha-ketoglutaric semialdehyde dehydrogenase
VTFHGRDPLTGALLEPPYVDATLDDIDAACRRAEDAAPAYAALPAARRAQLLRAIADALEAQGAPLVARARAETGLPLPRLEGERGRTTAQLRLFAEVVDDGSWVEARIDRALPERKPERPDIRRMLHPLGPVAVFGASNFPLAFSVAGGDTASALAAGCPVVVKAHPAHPGTSDLAGEAIRTACAATQMPDGVFGMVQGAGADVGGALVEHPAIRAVAFTGSLRGGRALFDIAARRPSPVPFYGELGSANPVFVLPTAMAARGAQIAAGLVASVTLGSGQFCTNPGLAFLDGSSAADAFLQRVCELVAAAPAGTMVHEGIRAAFDADVAKVAALDGVALAAQGNAAADPRTAAARTALFVADGAAYLRHERLAAEIYGPATVAVRCADRAQLLDIARSLTGHLTATLHADGDDLAAYADLVDILRTKVGRLVVNGFPTGVEVSHAMHHGGPYPAATDPRATSVGSAAIARFVRPVCYQGFPDAALPVELRRANERGIFRLVDGALTRDPA